MVGITIEVKAIGLYADDVPKHAYFFEGSITDAVNHIRAWKEAQYEAVDIELSRPVALPSDIKDVAEVFDIRDLAKEFPIR
ncbi:hypothetical protein EFR84_11600 [Rhizobium chutanense]|uniref:Uncharacterized protein n=2 Tax=Rhizobium chutanense TaxID=2035448 RepID=A0A3S0SXW0_9HYPH|nr:hypothetical protein EFR84_11600 [Rhizobium chutanense]